MATITGYNRLAKLIKIPLTAKYFTLKNCKTPDPSRFIQIRPVLSRFVQSYPDSSSLIQIRPGFSRLVPIYQDKSGQIRTNRDESGQIRTNRDESGQIETCRDGSGRLGRDVSGRDLSDWVGSGFRSLVAGPADYLDQCRLLAVHEDAHAVDLAAEPYHEHKR